MLRSAGLSLAALTIAFLAPLGAGWAQSDAPCTWDSAQAMSVRALERAQADLRGRCVRVRAQSDGWALRVSEQRGIAGEETLIGAYFEDEALRASLAERPRRVEALGVVGHCSDICANSGDDVVCMAVGYCHYHYGDPYVMISAVQ
jgi:hypothetical protein